MFDAQMAPSSLLNKEEKNTHHECTSASITFQLRKKHETAWCLRACVCVSVSVLCTRMSVNE